MLKDFPTFIDPLRLAQENCVLRGHIAVEQFSRILNSLCNTQGTASFEWLFTTDEQHPIIKGWIKAPLQMVCQRCLQQMTWDLETQVSLVILTDDQSDKTTPPDYETLVITKIPVSLVALIEDEIILALPIAVTHDKCLTNDYCLPDEVDSKVKDQQDNPFQVLKMLKN
jgi:uncharacterized protein